MLPSLPLEGKSIFNMNTCMTKICLSQISIISGAWLLFLQPATHKSHDEIEAENKGPHLLTLDPS